MTAYRDGTDHLCGYAPPLCTALIRKPLTNLQRTQLRFSGSRTGVVSAKPRPDVRRPVDRFGRGADRWAGNVW